MSLILYKTKKTKSQIEDEYWNEMFRGCMCTIPKKKILEDLLNEYKSLGYSGNELISNILTKQSLNYYRQISDGSTVIGYYT